MTARHNLITANLIGHLYGQVRQNGCQIFPSDMRVQAVDQQVYTYPDLTIVCGPPQYAEPSQMTLLNPTVIVEVLSPSTATRDRKEKLVYYRTIDTLQAYVLMLRLNHTCNATPVRRRTFGMFICSTTALIRSRSTRSTAPFRSMPSTKVSRSNNRLVASGSLHAYIPMA